MEIISGFKNFHPVFEFCISQGFFRKGNVLLEMGRQTEALIQFYRCLKQHPDFAPAKNQIKKVGIYEIGFDEMIT